MLEEPGEYTELADLVRAVATTFETETGRTQYVLDFEYKKVAPDGRLVVKQVREIPQAAAGESVTPFMVADGTLLCTEQGEGPSGFSTQRLRTHLRLDTVEGWLTTDVLEAGVVTSLVMDHVAGCRLGSRAGPVDTWPGHEQTWADGLATLRFRLDELANPRQYEMRFAIPETLPAVHGPLLSLSDTVSSVVNVTHDRPVPVLDEDPPGSTSTERIDVAACRERSEQDLPQFRSASDTTLGVSVSTQFWWEPPPWGVDAGYTAPAVAFDQTWISGLTSTPLVLTSEWSQTYAPEHHNFEEWLVFEPGLDPGVSAEQLAELEAVGARIIVLVTSPSPFPGEGLVRIHDSATWGDACAPCWGGDADSDGTCAPDDCNDADASAWSMPGPIDGLRVRAGGLLSWSPPPEPGATAVRHDVLRALDSADFVTGVTCLESDDGGDLVALDAESPGPGSVFHYLVRAVNDCPSGDGSTGNRSDGTPRDVGSCP